MILNWTNLVRDIRRTATKLKLRSICSGNIRPVWRTLPLVESKKISPVDEEEIQIQMDDRVDTSFASEGIDLFVDLWEVQPCLWDPK